MYPTTKLNSYNNKNTKKIQ